MNARIHSLVAEQAGEKVREWMRMIHSRIGEA